MKITSLHPSDSICLGATSRLPGMGERQGWIAIGLTIVALAVGLAESMHLLGSGLGRLVGVVAAVVLFLFGLGLILRAFAFKGWARTLARAVEIGWKAEEFQSQLAVYERLGNCLSVTYTNRSLQDPLVDCRLHLDSIVRIEDNTPPPMFSVAYLRWDHGEATHNLGPGERIAAPVVRHDPSFVSFVQAAQYTTALPASLPEGRWRATLTLRADGCSPLTHSFDFEYATDAETSPGKPGHLRFLDASTQPAVRRFRRLTRHDRSPQLPSPESGDKDP